MSPLLRSLVRLAKPILSRTLYRPGQRARILFGPARGLRYRIFPGFGLAHLYGGWESDAQRAILPHIVPGGVAYDVGANYGLYTLLMARLVMPAGWVYAFEPMPPIHAELVRNVQLNQFDHVECIPKAVSDRTGTARFIVGHHAGAGYLATGGRGSPGPTPSTPSFDVEQIKLDDLIRQGARPPTFIKVDVEGSEAAVLRGARAILTKHRPVLLIELHTPAQDVAVGTLLKDLGYTARRVEKGKPPVLNLTSGWPNPNGLWGQIIALPAERVGGSATK